MGLKERQFRLVSGLHTHHVHTHMPTLLTMNTHMHACAHSVWIDYGNGSSKDDYYGTFDADSYYLLQRNVQKYFQAYLLILLLR